MGCCGCSLYASVITAFIFTLVESLYGIVWNVLVIMVLHVESSNSTLYENSVTEFLITTYKKTESNGPIPGIVITALILNAVWLVSAISLLWGNVHSSRHHMRPWIAGTILIMATDIAATIYFFVRSGQDGILKSDVKVEEVKELFHDRFFLTAILFCRGAIVIWIINLALIVFVCQRMTEIGVIKTSQVIDTLRKKTHLENTYEMSDMKGSLRSQTRENPHLTNGKPNYGIPPVDYEHIDPRGRTYEDHEPQSQMNLPRKGITNASKWTYLPGGANLDMSRSEIRRPPTPDYDEEPNETYSRRMEQVKDKEYIKPYPRAFKNAAYENRGFESEADNSKNFPPERSIPRVRY